MHLRNNMGGILGCVLIIWAKMRNHRKAAMLCTGVPYGLMFSMMPMVWDLFLNQKENKASGPTERHSFNTLLQETKSKAEGCTTPIFFFFWKVPSLVAQHPSAQDICVYDWSSWQSQFCWLPLMQPLKDCLECFLTLWLFIKICFSEDSFRLYDPLASPLSYWTCQYFNLCEIRLCQNSISSALISTDSSAWAIP